MVNRQAEEHCVIGVFHVSTVIMETRYSKEPVEPRRQQQSSVDPKDTQLHPENCPNNSQKGHDSLSEPESSYL
jgi:hypothetical protein